MKLLTKELEQRFAKIGSQENGKDPIVVCKFFDPTGAATWLATEYDPATKEFFGFAGLFGLKDSGTAEYGYFSLNELENVKGRFGLGIERDLHTPEQRISEYLK
jgi:hypothetical protein